MYGYRPCSSCMPTCPHKWCEKISFETIDKGTRNLMAMACGMTRIVHLIDEVKKREALIPKDTSRWVAEYMDLEGVWRSSEPTTKSQAEYMAGFFGKQFDKPMCTRISEYKDEKSSNS